MQAWLKAESPQDVGRFYNDKYNDNGYEAFTNNDRSDVVAMFEKHGGAFYPGLKKRLLDAGCGHGEFIKIIHTNVTCFGFDVSSAAIQLAKERNIRASFYNIDIVNIPSEIDGEQLDGTFDYVTCLGVIEHTMNPTESHHRMMKLLKPGGVLLITAPLQFKDCLQYIQAETNTKTNERFADWEEWVAMFGPQQPEEWFRVGDSDQKDVWLIYKKEGVLS